MKKLIVILCCIFTVQLHGQYVHNERYKTLDVTGEMKSLTIIGEERTNTVIEAKNGDINKANFDVATRKKKLMLEFAEEKIDFVVRVPKEVGLIIKPYDIVFEGMFDAEKDRRKITIENIQGSIDVATDGYHVDLVRSNNDISVVSYLDIFADSIAMREGGSISMDSYWGDVLLRPIPPLDAQITMRAKQGMVELDSLLKIAEERILIDNNIAVIVGEGTSDILLHSEKGAHVLLDMQEEMDRQLLNAEEILMEAEIQLENAEIQLQNAEIQLELAEIDLESVDIDIFTDKYELLQNEPNPWRKSTKISYFLAEDKDVEFEFIDNNYELIFSTVEKGKKGMNVLKLNRKRLPTTGIIYYRMKIGDVIYSKKMIHLD